MTKKTLRNFDAYLERFPKNVQRLLQKMRLTIKKAAPQAKETISYGIPRVYPERTAGLVCGPQKPHWLLSESFSNRLRSRRSYQPTKERKGRCNFPSTRLFPWLSLAAS
jgi:uncharacterized protein YdhG (YjbR/CyaY superfamily)